MGRDANNAKGLNERKFSKGVGPVPALRKKVVRAAASSNDSFESCCNPCKGGFELQGSIKEDGELCPRVLRNLPHNAHA